MYDHLPGDPDEEDQPENGEQRILGAHGYKSVVDLF